MGFYRDRILPRLVERTLSAGQFKKLRRTFLFGLKGTVLEIGFGSGLNLPFYPEEVERLLACDPAELGRRMAKNRLAETKIPVEFVGLDGQNLPLDNAVVDHVVTTWTLCTIPDVHRSLAEIKRVLRNGGSLHFLEHGRAIDEKLARWQDRLNPFHKRLAGGCNLNRRIDEMIDQSGLETKRLENFFIKGPSLGGFMYGGVAVKNGRLGVHESCGP
jgi:ubiquinone/menaquinone biosynthesis C-methylase UbiE